MKYRKKPVIINAIKISEICEYAQNNWKGLPSWVENNYNGGKIIFLPDGVDIKTMEGIMRGGIDDILIEGVKGEIYPCKPDIFEATYEKVEE